MWSSNWEQVTATLSCLFFFFSYFPSHNSKSFNITTGCCFFFCVTPLVNSSNDFAKILVSSASSSTPKTPPPWVDVDYTMQLYHHPFSVDSQKVRLALEENGIDYTSYHMNPLTGKNMEASFFRMNPSAKLPVFQNGSHIIYNTIEIIQYIERIAAVSSVGDDIHLSSEEVIQWMHKIQQWNPKYFTLLHVPEMHRLYVSKFIRRVVITRMAEFPDLASAYHFRLRDAYDTEEKLKDLEVLRRSKEELVRLLDEVEAQLKETSYLAGEEFTMADVMLMPILARLILLKLEDEYINNRPNIAQYWNMVQQRASYKKVIGKYFDGWRRRKTLMKTWCFIHVRSMLRKY